MFERSIAGLRKLNALGYGVAGSGLKLDLVYNPGGAFLPPPQEMLRAKYTEELQSSFGIVFNELFTMTNMPIKRFADQLYKQGQLEAYMALLVDSVSHTRPPDRPTAPHFPQRTPCEPMPHAVQPRYHRQHDVPLARLCRTRRLTL